MYLCHPTKCGTVTFLASLGGLDITVHPSYQEENPRSGLTAGAVTESLPFFKLQHLVVFGGKWLPFSLVGGVPMFVREPPLVAYKWIPRLHGKEVATSDHVVYIISCQGLSAHKE